VQTGLARHQPTCVLVDPSHKLHVPLELGAEYPDSSEGLSIIFVGATGAAVRAACGAAML